MFDHASRYYSLPVATFEYPDGRVVSYVRRRFLPRGDGMPLLAEVRADQGERIDNFSNRTLGDPLAYWRICDANNAVDPLGMMEEASAHPARLLRIPVPQA